MHLRCSDRDRALVKRMLPGTLLYIRWPNGDIQEAVRISDFLPTENGALMYLGHVPDNTALEDVPVIVMDEDQHWSLVQ